MPATPTTTVPPVEILRSAGLLNPARVVTMIRDTIAFLELDLSGLSVLTEAASGPFVVTPVIAALAGAREVVALTRDSRHATVDEVVRETRALEALCGIEGRVEIRTTQEPAIFARPDVVTNLGFVRPLDRDAIDCMRPGAVIALMYESWEFRDADLDLDACRKRGVGVFGTNEDFPGLEVFAYSGWVGVQLLMEAQIELHKSRIAVIGSDKFGRVIFGLLTRAGADATLHARLDRDAAQRADAILVADYTRRDAVIGEGGDLSVEELARVNGAVTVVQFVGRVDLDGLRRAGIAVYPGLELESRRMVRTLAALGPRPVIELHSAGLKVGEIAVRTKTSGLGHRFAGLVQTLT